VSALTTSRRGAVIPLSPLSRPAWLPHSVVERAIRMNVSVPLISIVDDDPSVRRALGRLLHAAGYAVETYASAREFLDASPLHRTTCLLLDVHLGGMNGFDLRDQLTTEGVPFPIIFITAHDDSQTRERAGERGAAGYLTKPFNRRTLLEAIDSALGRAGTSPGSASDPPPSS